MLFCTHQQFSPSSSGGKLLFTRAVRDFNPILAQILLHLNHKFIHSRSMGAHQGSPSLSASTIPDAPSLPFGSHVLGLLLCFAILYVALRILFTLVHSLFLRSNPAMPGAPTVPRLSGGWRSWYLAGACGAKASPRSSTAGHPVPYSSSPTDVERQPNQVHLPCSHWAETGGRQYMEDRLSFRGRLGGREDASLYACFDGHGGALASEFCAQELPGYLVESEKNWEMATKSALKDAFAQTDAAFAQALAGTDRLDGTTALVSVVVGDKLFVANAGDSRAILVQRGARVVPLSRDHKPSLPDELERITGLGGKVIFWGRWRVEGVLAVSRAIGDAHLKPYVTPEPEVTEWEITEKDHFLVVASDGACFGGVGCGAGERGLWPWGRGTLSLSHACEGRR